MKYRKKTETTSKSLQSICPTFLNKLNQKIDLGHDKLLVAWPEIIGEKLASMTRAEKVEEGILYVVVSNSTLLSLLTMKEKQILLKKIREKFPKAAMKDIRFRIG